MVSTRQMSSVVGSSGSVEGASPSQSEPAAVSRVTRHSSALLPGGSSPHASSSKCTSVVPAPKNFHTNLLDLPVEILEKIFSYLGFKTVSHLRMVNIFHYFKICCFDWKLWYFYYMTNSSKFYRWEIMEMQSHVLLILLDINTRLIDL